VAAMIPARLCGQTQTRCPMGADEVPR
jgi:hypothetical protein